ncbi:MAG: hypothetical protein AB8H86_25080 [Polyangiales bacterium]
MSHNISGVVSAGRFCGLAEYDTAAHELRGGYKLIFMDHHYTEYWAKKLSIAGSLELPASMDPILLPYDRVIAELLKRTTHTPRFAIVWTEYFGGVGDQRAAAYEGEVLLECDGTINSALRQLGASRGEHRDEFDALGLQHIRGNPDAVTQAWTKYP